MQIRTLCCFLLLSLVLISPALLFPQHQVPVSDPQAVALANPSRGCSHKWGNDKRCDPHRKRNLDCRIGQRQWSGHAHGRGTGQSRMDLKLSGGSSSEVRNAPALGVGLGQWMDANGLFHDFAFHNCLTDAAWFSPKEFVLL